MECNKALIEAKPREILEMKPDETKIYKCKECAGKKICSYYQAKLKYRWTVNGAIFSLLIAVISLEILGIKVWLKYASFYIAIPASTVLAIYMIIELIKLGKDVKDIVLKANSEITYSTSAGSDNDHTGNS